MVFALSVALWVRFARLVRGETLKIRELEYIQAAHAFGVRHHRIISRHILPNVMHIVLISMVMEFSGLVLAEAVSATLGSRLGKAKAHELIEAEQRLAAQRIEADRLLARIETARGPLADLRTRAGLDAAPDLEIAAALVQAHRASMPAPEELIDRSPAERSAPVHRPGFDDVVWFSMNIGRRQNADPRWILPLICRRGHITKSEIGAIRIGAGETRFQIPTKLADRFAKEVAKTAAQDEDGVLIEVADGPPPPGTRGDHAPRHHKPRNHDRPVHRARPAKPHHRGKPPKK